MTFFGDVILIQHRWTFLSRTWVSGNGDGIRFGGRERTSYRFLVDQRHEGGKGLE